MKLANSGRNLVTLSSALSLLCALVCVGSLPTPVLGQVTPTPLFDAKEWKEDPERPRTRSDRALSATDYRRALENTGQLAAMAQQRMPSDTSWSHIGPQGNYGDRNGRIAQIQIRDEGGLPVLYVGASGGGLWFNDTIQGDARWQSIGDELENPSVRAFAIHPTDPNTIFVGTGDRQRYDGAGLFQTTDRGVSWSEINTPGDPSHFDRIYYLPGGNQDMIACNSERIIRSTNGGTTWQTALPMNTSALAFSEVNPTLMYSWSMGDSTGIYRSTDSGENWQRVFTVSVPNGEFVSRSSMAVFEPDPNHAVLFGYTVDVDGKGVQEFVYRTTNGGNTWIDITPDDADAFNENQMFHAQAVTYHPSDSDRIYIASINLARTTNGGDTWQVDVGENGINIGHADVTHLQFSDLYGDDILWICNDGGIFQADLAGSSTVSWNGNASTGISCSQIDFLDAEAAMRVIGTQDNGIVSSYNAGANWSFVRGGDGGDVEITDVNAQEYYFNDGVYTNDPRWRTWIKPFGQAPVYTAHGGGDYLPQIYHDWMNQRVFTQTNGDSILVSPKGSVNNWSFVSQSMPGNRRIYGSVIDGNTLLIDYFKSQGNQRWVSILRETSPGNWTTTNKEIAPDGQQILEIASSAETPGESWAGLTGSSGEPKLLHTKDYWETYDDISGILADVGSVEAIAVTPFNSAQIFVGTDVGMYWTRDGGETWETFQNGLPIVTCTDLRYVLDPNNVGNDKLIVSTYGRGVWDRQIAGRTIIYVDRTFAGLVEDGSLQRPFDTVPEGLAALPNAGGIIAMRGETYPEGVPITISQKVEFRSYDMAAVIDN